MTRPSTTPPASVLQAPSSSFSKLDIKTKEVRPSELVRSGPRNSGEPYFGKLGLHRFDDPGCTYGTCYLGFDLSTALAETLLHNVSAVNGQFVVERSRYNARWIVRFDDVSGQVLKLADMTGASLLQSPDGSLDFPGVVRSRRHHAECGSAVNAGCNTSVLSQS